MKKQIRLLFLFIPTAALAASVPDRIYTIDPNTWAKYSVVSCQSAIDNAAAFLANNGLGTVGAPGYVRGGRSTTGYHVNPNSLNELSVSYRYISGATGAHWCVDGNITGYPTHQCLNFDGQTGSVNSADPAITSYLIVPLGVDDGFWVSIVFKTAASFKYGDQAFPYAQLNGGVNGTPGQCSSWFNGQLVTGQPQ